MPDPGAPPRALGSGVGDTSHDHVEEVVVDRLLRAQRVVEERAAGLESAQLYRESNISKWRFGFLCVG